MVRKRLSHVDEAGKIRMVDVSAKEPTLRRAEASCRVRTVADVVALGELGTGMDRVHAARVAGIQAAKQTANLIPLCHPLGLSAISIDIRPSRGGFEILASVSSVTATGVEMESLTACAIAALSLVASLLTLDPTAHIQDLVLERKSGGKSGDWGRQVNSLR